MSTLPYLPAGQAQLPAERIVVFGDLSNRVQRFDESVRLGDGAAISAYWESSTINKEEVGRLWRFDSIRFLYFAEADATMAILFSSNGGENWTTRNYPFRATEGTRLRTAMLWPDIVGEDLRFRINFHATIIVNIVGFMPRVRRAGLIRQGGIR